MPIKIGVPLVRNVTSATGRNSNAVFSVRKYMVPPVTPRSASVASSLNELANRRLGPKIHIQMYANINLHRQISAGLNPLFISILVDTNVVPQITIVRIANRWYMALFITRIFALKFIDAKVHFYPLIN